MVCRTSKDAQSNYQQNKTKCAELRRSTSILLSIFFGQNKSKHFLKAIVLHRLVGLKLGICILAAVKSKLLVLRSILENSSNIKLGNDKLQ